MNKPILPFVETMITQVCNLSCAGCTNYSDLNHRGHISWVQGREWIAPWLERITIPDFGIFGGEPLLNPEVDLWISGIRDLLPAAQIRFTTNGTLLRKKREVIKQLSEMGNCVFKITVHQPDPDLEDLIQEILNSYPWESVVEYGIKRYKTGNNFRFQINRPQTFIKTFRGSYQDMLPHNSDPANAFGICCQQTCPLLYQGRIYKCSSNGLLSDTLLKFDNPNFEDWVKYLDPGIGINSPDDEILQFIDNFGKPHQICGMCPSVTDMGAKLDHAKTVFLRKIKYID
jgi:sulfatase maturation enzyme AslB (radical SAM superfamily)